MSIVFTDRTADSLNPRQARALTVLIRHATEHHQEAAGHDIVHTIEVKRTDHRTAWVSIRRDIPTLGENNLLRALEAIETWHVHIGKRGKLEAYTYPKSLAQFSGEVWCGIHIMRTELEKREKRERAAKRAKVAL